MIITITWIVVIITALVLYLRQIYTTFSKTGVNHFRPIPFFGNVFRPFFNLENALDTLTTLAQAFPDDKVVGQYELVTPVYIVKDVETMKKITIKDFDHFVDRRSFATELDPMFGRGLVNLKGNEWREMRSTLSPAFTSSKIRLMVPLMVEVGEEMIKVLQERIKVSGKSIELELKDLTTRYANDVIASCAFGLKVDSQSENSYFYNISKVLTKFTGLRLMKVLLLRCFPPIANMLNVTLSPPEVTKFFTDVVLTTMDHRDKNKIVRHDMIQLLQEAKKGTLSHENEGDANAGFATVEESAVGKKYLKKEWSDTDLVAQVVLFLLAGFETVSTAMTFTLYELAVNPEIQERLAQEIKEYDTKNGGKLDFKSIQNMKYLDMVVSESLRLFPAAPVLDRKCVKDYNFGRVNTTSDKDLIIRKGATIGFPIWLFHRDPKLFPDPLKFDPERFSDENKHNIESFSYMPFGQGPRNCIGSRFALCEVKVMLYQLLRVMKLSPCEKTPIPAELVKGFQIDIKDGAWVRVELRQ